MAKRTQRTTSDLAERGTSKSAGSKRAGSKRAGSKRGAPATKGAASKVRQERRPAGAAERGGARRPMYARALRLRALRPGPVLCFLFFEGTIAVAAVLALVGLVSWWGVLALPLAVAVSVKLNDVIVSGAQQPYDEDDDADEDEDDRSAYDPRRDRDTPERARKALRQAPEPDRRGTDTTRVDAFGGADEVTGLTDPARKLSTVSQRRKAKRKTPPPPPPSSFEPEFAEDYNEVSGPGHGIGISTPDAAPESDDSTTIRTPHDLRGGREADPDSEVAAATEHLSPTNQDPAPSPALDETLISPLPHIDPVVETTKDQSAAGSDLVPERASDPISQTPELPESSGLPESSELPGIPATPEFPEMPRHQDDPAATQLIRPVPPTPAGEDDLDGFMTDIRGNRPSLAERQQAMASPAPENLPAVPARPVDRRTRARSIVRAARQASRSKRK